MFHIWSDTEWVTLTLKLLIMCSCSEDVCMTSMLNTLHVISSNIHIEVLLPPVSNELQEIIVSYDKVCS